MEPSPDVLSERLAVMETELAALRGDRDFWRRQHDLVMTDWKSDCDAYEAELAARVKPPPAILPMTQTATGSPEAAALTDLLRFYDPDAGAVHVQRDGDFLFDAFARAHAATAPALKG